MRLITLCLLCSLLTASARTAVPTAYVVNSNGETLSKINLTSGAVTQNIVTLGSDIQCAPNQIIVRDTLAYVVVSLTDEIQVVNLNTQSTAAFIPTGQSGNPYWMEIYDSQYLYVSLLLGNAILKIDYITHTAVDTIPVGKSPSGLAIADHKLYVANSGFDFGTFLYDPGTVTVIDLTTDQPIDTIAVGLNPQTVLVDRAARVHVICTGDYFSVFGSAYIIDPVAHSVIDSVTLGGSPLQATMGPDNIVSIAAGGFSSADGYVYSYDALAAAPLHTQGNPLVVDSGCIGVSAYQDSSVLASSLSDFVTRIDSAGSLVAAYPVGDGPVHIDFNYQPGDINGDFTVNLTDLTALVNHQFVTFEPFPQPSWRANVNGDFKLNLTDLTVLVNHLFVTFQPLKAGPRWYNP
jgi:DNA-binding beta-propeller fold protein YncE